MLKLTTTKLFWQLAFAPLLLITTTLHAGVPRLNSDASSAATVFLDFDGHVVEGTAWNWDSTIRAQPANLSEAVVREIFQRVAEDFRIFQINITTDQAVYDRAAVARRVRIIITPTHKWYGEVAGIAFINSFNWADGTPAWVFSELLQRDPKYIGEAVSHEIGHTLGLQHQSTYDQSCNMTTEYAEGIGEGEIGWAPIMGVGYYRNITTWHTGTSVEGCDVIQNDIDVIVNGEQRIALRKDDHKDHRNGSTSLPSANKDFSVAGLVNSSADIDVFRIVLNKKSSIKAALKPNHVGSGYSGANVDMRLCLIKNSGDTVCTINPATFVSASFDTTLPQGTYYLAVEGVDNRYMRDYGSVGHYTLAGTIEPLASATKPTLVGKVLNGLHFIEWIWHPDEALRETVLECSENGTHFKPMATFIPSVTDFANNPAGTGTMYYRVKMVTGGSAVHYSNTVSLRSDLGEKMFPNGNIVRHSIRINASRIFGYQITDEGGRLLQKGRLTPGLNIVPVTNSRNGVLMMKVFDEKEQRVFKLLKQ